MLTLDRTSEGLAVWTLTADGVERRVHEAYTPTLYVGDAVTDLYGRRGGETPSPPDRDALSPTLAACREFLRGQAAVADLSVESHRQTFRTDARPLLRVDAANVDALRSVARRIEEFGEPDATTCYDVDLTRQLRFSLETGTPAAPDRSVRSLRTLSLATPSHLSGDAALTALTIDGDRAGSEPRAVVRAVADAVRSRDPDVLVLSTAEIVPLLFDAADAVDVTDAAGADAAGADTAGANATENAFALGRDPGYTKLAGASTYTSYGRVGHSPARYTVPGRVVLDESNSFFYHEAGLAGCLDLVERSGLPLEELGWASIGRVLTAMQVRAARDRDVLVPWRAWRPELFTSAATLDDADRGGTTLAPETGIHEDVYELDFASLYPNIIRTRNVSPETVRCGCCDGRDVPGLGYSICEADGYLPSVLGPLIDARSDLKRRRRAATDPDERERLAAAADALKWILVSCFGYQGFSNAKFGRIECHEAINAFAREILLTAKTALEDAGWRVVHGIVDSLWVTPAADRDQRPLEDVAAEVSDRTGIALERECAFEWVGFCPARDADHGALTRYFGKRRGATVPSAGGLDDAIKVRGIEGRQRSTPPWVETVQNDALRAFDATRSPEAVCDALRRHLSTLRAGAVAPSELVVANRVSKDVDAYAHETLTVAALRRAEREGAGLSPGKIVRYVVVDADGYGAERVRLAFEGADAYDVEWYADAAVRAVSSVLSPVGWREPDVRDYLATTTETTLGAYRG